MKLVDVEEKDCERPEQSDDGHAEVIRHAFSRVLKLPYRSPKNYARDAQIPHVVKERLHRPVVCRDLTNDLEHA